MEGSAFRIVNTIAVTFDSLKYVHALFYITCPWYSETQYSYLNACYLNITRNMKSKNHVIEKSEAG